MTAHLKRGDRVFYTYPSNPSPQREREDREALDRMFRAQGVDVAGNMGLQGLNAKFEVVAVFREDGEDGR
jgi:hypothetical protein